MRFRLKRVTKSAKFTAGVLINEADGFPICLTLENPWINNDPNISCIQNGAYRGVRYSSERFRNVYLLQQVPRRTNILIHKGNTAQDTSGCILLGSHFGILNDKMAVLDSTKAFAVFSGLVKGDDFELIICN